MRVYISITLLVDLDAEPDKEVDETANLDDGSDLHMCIEAIAKRTLDVELHVGVDVDENLEEELDDSTKVEKNNRQEGEVDVDVDDAEDFNAGLDNQADGDEDLDDGIDASLNREENAGIDDDERLQLLNGGLDNNDDLANCVNANVGLDDVRDENISLQVRADIVDLDHDVGEDGFDGVACAGTGTATGNEGIVVGGGSRGGTSEGSESGKESGDHCDGIKGGSVGCGGGL